MRLANFGQSTTRFVFCFGPNFPTQPFSGFGFQLANPIRLTTFEEYFFWEDRPAYPFSCFMRAHFSGRFKRAVFESALNNVLQRHVLLRSIVKQRRGRLFWHPQENPKPQIVWTEGPVGSAMPQAAHLDLRTEIGFRVFVNQGDDASEVVFQFHHSCCDGAGFLGFFDEVLTTYAIDEGADVDGLSLPELDPERLKHRNQFGLKFGKYLKVFRQQLIGLHGAKQFFQRKPAPLSSRSNATAHEPLSLAYPALCSYRFDAQQTKRLRKIGRQKQVTLNDLLARDFFLAIAQWRRQREESANDWIRMMVPMNMREVSDKKLPAANVVSSIFLDRRGADFESPQTLLEGIHEEMNLIKERRLGLMFIFSLRMLRWLPGGLKRAAGEDKCTTSCVFTNLGKPFLQSRLPRKHGKLVAGGLTLEEIDLVAPIRPYNNIALAIQTYAKQLGITVHYDPRPLTAADAQELLDIYVAQIEQTIKGD